MVQHRAVRYIVNDYAFTSSVTEMLDKIGLPAVENRRKIASFVMLYKIHTDQVRISLPPYITPLLCNRFSIPHSSMYSFFPRTARLWNNLPLALSVAQTWKHSGLGWLYTFSKYSSSSSSSSPSIIIFISIIHHYSSLLKIVSVSQFTKIAFIISFILQNEINHIL